MKIVETKIYKVEIKGDVERAHLNSIAEKLDKIACLLRGKEVFYKDFDNCECKMEIEKIDEMADFVRALAIEEVEII